MGQWRMEALLEEAACDAETEDAAEAQTGELGEHEQGPKKELAQEAGRGK